MRIKFLGTFQILVSWILLSRRTSKSSTRLFRAELENPGARHVHPGRYQGLIPFPDHI